MERARDLLIQHTRAPRFCLRRCSTSSPRLSRGGGAATTPGKSAGDGDALGDVMSPGAAPQDPEAAAHALLAGLGPEPEGYDWEAAYKSGMESLGTFGELTAAYPSGTSSRSLTKTARTMTRAVSHPSRKKLARECAALSENQLPCEAGSSIFLRHDPDSLIACARGHHRAGRDADAAVVSCLTFTFRGYPEKPPMEPRHDGKQSCSFQSQPVR